MIVVSASVSEAIPIPSFEVVEDDLFNVPLPNLGLSGVAGSFKKVIKQAPVSFLFVLIIFASVFD